MNKGYTIEDLYFACKQEMNRGNGDKRILISSDDEGNKYHRLYFLFTSDENDVDSLSSYFTEREDKINHSDIVVLG